MGKAIKLGSGVGCALGVLGPLTAVILYPRGKWLFAFALVGVGVLVLNHLLAKDPSAATLADQIEAFLNGKSAGWDVDDFEHQQISNPQLRASWRRSMEIGGLPEQWGGLDEEKKKELCDLVRNLRNWTPER
jgi:hypothetical protein